MKHLLLALASFLFFSAPVQASHSHASIDALATDALTLSRADYEAVCAAVRARMRAQVSMWPVVDLFPGPSDPIWIDASLWVEPQLPDPVPPIRDPDENEFRF